MDIINKFSIFEKEIKLNILSTFNLFKIDNDLINIIKKNNHNLCWYLALHLSQSTSGICPTQSFLNLAMASTNAEYYLTYIPKNKIYSFTLKKNIDSLFHNISFYDLKGNLLKKTDLNHKQNKEQYIDLVYPSNKTIKIKGPALAWTRFYKHSTMLNIWACDLNWLPIVKDETNSTHILILNTTNKNQIIKNTKLFKHFFQKKIYNSIIKNRPKKTIKKNINERKTKKKKLFMDKQNPENHFFIPLPTQIKGLFANMNSAYSFYNIKHKNLYSIKIKFPKINTKLLFQKNKSITICFSDLMICDNDTTATLYSFPCDQIGYNKTEILINHNSNKKITNNTLQDIITKKKYYYHIDHSIHHPILVFRIVFKFKNNKYFNVYETDTTINNILISPNIICI